MTEASELLNCLNYFVMRCISENTCFEQVQVKVIAISLQMGTLEEGRV